MIKHIVDRILKRGDYAEEYFCCDACLFNTDCLCCTGCLNLIPESEWVEVK